MMGGFERFTVIEPPDSRGVKARIDTDNTQIQLTLRPQRTETITPIRDAAITINITISIAHHGKTVNSYVGATSDGSTVTLAVFVSPELSSNPAHATLVRGPHFSTIP